MPQRRESNLSHSLADVAELLQEAAQVLHKLANSNPANHTPRPSEQRVPSSSPQNKEDVLVVFTQARDELTTLVMLLQNLDSEANFSGLDLYMIGEALSRPLNILSSACLQLAEVNAI